MSSIHRQRTCPSPADLAILRLRCSWEFSTPFSSPLLLSNSLICLAAREILPHRASPMPITLGEVFLSSLQWRYFLSYLSGARSDHWPSPSKNSRNHFDGSRALSLFKSS